MTNGSVSVLVPKQDGRMQIPQESLTLMCLNFSTNQVVGLISGGDPSVNDVRRGNPALIFLDLGLADAEKRHHISTFMGSLRNNPNKPLKTAEKLDISDKGQILLPPEFLSLFQDTERRARLVLLNGKGQATHGFALSFQQKFPYGSNGRL